MPWLLGTEYQVYWNLNFSGGSEEAEAWGSGRLEAGKLLKLTFKGSGQKSDARCQYDLVNVGRYEVGQKLTVEVECYGPSPLSGDLGWRPSQWEELSGYYTWIQGIPLSPDAILQETPSSLSWHWVKSVAVFGLKDWLSITTACV